MKNIISRLIMKKNDHKPHNFTQILSEPKKMVIFFSNNPVDSFEIISYIPNWKKLFREYFLVFPEYEFSFFKRFQILENINFLRYDDLPPFNDCVILNLCEDKNHVKHLKQSRRSTIIGLNGTSNLKFIPTPSEPVQIIRSFAEFFNFPLKKTKLELELTPSESSITKQRFIQNRFNNFVLDLNGSTSTKMIEKLVIGIKRNFSANIYLTGKSINKKDYLNIVDVKVENLFDLFALAKKSNLFFSDNYRIARLFSLLNVDIIFLGEKNRIDNTDSIYPDNIYEWKDLVTKVITKDNNPVS
ncbi:MAG: hypothetical protein K8R49_03360 [Candidatus Cloacimonetes bacterium]|nr:hypothetical protein [Candidatus Cloacimonadota bacterium]